ncbi:Fe-S cluster assembly scaffold SufA [Erwinia sp. CPCC 100877]|nr:Fe-S cluster assembly scaffold SufA [Erwinia sp. CPCC 100877]
MELQAGTFDPGDFAWQGLTLTSAAAEQIRQLTQRESGVLGLRLGVKKSGCAGFGYVLDTVSAPQADDLLYQRDGARLYVSTQAMPFIDGTEVDYVREGLNQVFKFHNPKVQNECGCGESFGVQAE